MMAMLPAADQELDSLLTRMIQKREPEILTHILMAAMAAGRRPNARHLIPGVHYAAGADYAIPGQICGNAAGAAPFSGSRNRAIGRTNGGRGSGRIPGSQTPAPRPRACVSGLAQTIACFSACLHADVLEVVELINRRDLDRRIRNLIGSVSKS